MNVITERITYLPATDEPLSAEVYLIKGDQRCYVYDVGNNNGSLRYINQIEKEKTVILSHYHKDHIGNIEDINYAQLYIGRKTYETIGRGEIVDEVCTINDGVKIEILQCISPHTEGSLIVNVDNEYTLIADLYFTKPPFEKEKAMQMIAFLEKLDTKYFVVSHQKDKVIEKEKMLKELAEYFEH